MKTITSDLVVGVDLAPGLIEVDPRIIQPNPEQPRQHFDEESLVELANSLIENGFKQHPTVEILPDGAIQLVDGERRLRASIIAGFDLIPVVAQAWAGNADEARLDRLTATLVANTNHDGMTPIEIAKAYQRMRDEFGLKVSAIAKKAGKSTAYVYSRLRLLKLHLGIQQMIDNDEFTANPEVITSLLNLPQDAAFELVTTMKSKGSSYSAIERAAQKLGKKLGKTSDSFSLAPTPSLHLAYDSLPNALPPGRNSNIDLERLAIETCQACPIEKKSPTPPLWLHLEKAAKGVCGDCVKTLGKYKSLCAECPAVALLMAAIRGAQNE